MQLEFINGMKAQTWWRPEPEFETYLTKFVAGIPSGSGGVAYVGYKYITRKK